VWRDYGHTARYRYRCCMRAVVSPPRSEMLRLRLLVAVVSWFGFSALCTSGAKLTLVHLAPRAGSCALTLTLLQFTFSALVSITAMCVLGRSMPAAPRELLLVSLSYTLGFLLLNCSLGRLQASFSETVRGLEPLTSFALVRLFSHGKPLGGASSAALLAVLGGAALSVWAQPAFDAQGFACTAAGLQPLAEHNKPALTKRFALLPRADGLLANCAFSSRALLVISLRDATRRRHVAESSRPDGGDDHGIDPVGLFAAQHVLGLLLLAPAAIGAEGTQCAVVLTRDVPAARAAALSAVGFIAYNFLSLYVLLLIDPVSHSARAASLLSSQTRVPSEAEIAAPRHAAHGSFSRTGLQHVPTGGHHCSRRHRLPERLVTAVRCGRGDYNQWICCLCDCFSR
jgi:hypothetical protein